jgi:hypothetical protein
LAREPTEGVITALERRSVPDVSKAQRALGFVATTAMYVGCRRICAAPGT